MKIKSIFAALTFAGVLMAASNVYAATEIKLGEPSSTSLAYGAEFTIPVLINSTDEEVKDIRSVDAEVTFEKSKIYFTSVTSNLITTTEDPFGGSSTAPSGSITAPAAATVNANGKFRFIWDSTDKTLLSDSSSAFTLNLRGFVKDGYTFNPEDISIKLNSISCRNADNTETKYFAPSEGYKFATYVSFDIPKNITGYDLIHNVYLNLDGTNYKLNSYVETEDAYRFITSINNTKGAKKSVVGKVVFDTAKTEDAADSELTKNVDYKEIGTFTVNIEV